MLEIRKAINPFNIKERMRAKEIELNKKKDINKADDVKNIGKSESFNILERYSNNFKADKNQDIKP